MDKRVKTMLSLVCGLALFMSTLVLYPIQVANAKDYTSLGCVSWVKDRAKEKLGITLPSTGLNEYGLYGASAYWTNLNDYSKGSTPASNSLAVWKYNNGSDGQDGKYGHVAFVEEVNGDQVTVTEGGCAGYSYAGHTGVIRRTQSSSKMATLGGCSSFLGYIYLSGAPGHDPEGCVDQVTGGQGLVIVGGWAFDRDDTNASIEVHVYIGKDASTWEGFPLVANQPSEDVNNVYSIGGNHRFGHAITTSKRGNQDVSIYLINIGGGGNVLLGKYTANISDPAPATTPTPAVAPTTAPTVAPTIAPTIAPTVAPTIAPTLAPTIVPSSAPTTSFGMPASKGDIEATSIKFSATSQNAVISSVWCNNKQVTFTGLVTTMYDSNCKELLNKTLTLTAINSKSITCNIDINENLKYTLTAGTKYFFQFALKSGENLYYSPIVEFSTANVGATSAPTTTSTPVSTTVPVATVTPAPTSNPVISDDDDIPIIPSFSLKSLKAGFRVTVTKQTGMSWYDIQYSLKRSMKPYKITTIFQEDGSSKNIKYLKKKKKYYVRVRAYGNGITSAWSSIRIIKTK